MALGFSELDGQSITAILQSYSIYIWSASPDIAGKFAFHEPISAQVRTIGALNEPREGPP